MSQLLKIKNLVYLQTIRKLKENKSKKNVAKLLETLGKYSHSSESHQKIFDYLKESKLQISFLRGLIDGDGSFYWNNKEKYAQFTLASNYNQDWSFLCEYLKQFSPHIAKDIDSSGKSSVLRITGRENEKALEYVISKYGGLHTTRSKDSA